MRSVRESASEKTAGPARAAQYVRMSTESRAAHKLGESGIESHTLQRELIRNEAPNDGQKRLFVIDESSLASTKQMNELFHRLQASDRVLLVGDTPYRNSQQPGNFRHHFPRTR